MYIIVFDLMHIYISDDANMDTNVPCSVNGLVINTVTDFNLDFWAEKPESSLS